MGLLESINRIDNEVDTQTGLIAQIEAALVGKASGGTGKPEQAKTLDVTENDAYEVVPDDGYTLSKVTVNVEVPPEEPVLQEKNNITPTTSQQTITPDNGYDGLSKVVVNKIPDGYVVPSGTRTITENGTFDVTNYASVSVNVSGSGSVIKSGTTTSRTIDTGLSEVEQFFMYKETQTGTGLIRLHYTPSATSRMYASAWTTSNYGTKTITNGTGGVTVSGGTVTISATQAAQGALTSNVTYKWVAIGKE